MQTTPKNRKITTVSRASQVGVFRKKILVRETNDAVLSKTTELSCLGSRKADCSRKPGVRPYQRSRVSGNLVSPSSKLGKHKIEAVGAGETDVARSHVTPEIKRSFWEFPWRRRPGSTMTHMEGTINLEMMFLKNGYRLGDKLGKGSFAVVKKAVHLPTARDLAVKIVDHNLATKEFLEKFLSREMNIIGGLKHPNIIDVEKIVRIGAYTCVIMEQAKRGDLLEYILSRGSLPENETRSIFNGVVLAVQYLHSHNIAHRDLKCENILLDDHGQAKLSDFGFARFVIDQTTRRRVLSSTYCGSAAYVAPEVLRGTPYNPMLSDSWSLGVVLFIAVTGLMPFDDSDLPRMLNVQLKKRWGFPSGKRDQLSAQLQQLIRRMLEPDIMMRNTVTQILASDWLTRR